LTGLRKRPPFFYIIVRDHVSVMWRNYNGKKSFLVLKFFNDQRKKFTKKKKNEKKNCEQADTIKYVYSEPACDSHAEYNEMKLEWVMSSYRFGSNKVWHQTMDGF
jgi:hypothetical protein